MSSNSLPCRHRPGHVCLQHTACSAWFHAQRASLAHTAPGARGAHDPVLFAQNRMERLRKRNARDQKSVHWSKDSCFIFILQMKKPKTYILCLCHNQKSHIPSNLGELCQVLVNKQAAPLENLQHRCQFYSSTLAELLDKEWNES